MIDNSEFTLARHLEDEIKDLEGYLKPNIKEELSGNKRDKSHVYH